MKQEVIKSSMMDRIKGYLNALDDINGGQREFSTVATLLSSSEDILSDIKLFSTNIHMHNPKIVKRIKYGKCHSIDGLLKILIFTKPFSGLYSPWNAHKIPEKIFKEYKNYCLSNLHDFIDYAFKDGGINVRDTERNIELLLLKNREEYFIVMVSSKKDIKMIFFFYRKLFSKDEFYELFDSLTKI